MSLSIRTIDSGDMPAVSNRLMAEFPRDSMHGRNLRRQMWGDHHYDPEHNLLAVDDGDVVRGALLGVVRSGRAWIKVLTIGPDPAVPEALLAAFEDTLRRSLVSVIDVSGSSPYYLLPGVDPTDTRATVFYQTHGFRRVGEAFNMTCDLTQADLDTSAEETRLAKAGYRLARLTEEDSVALAEFVDRRFSNNWTIESLDALRNNPCTCHVAWHGRHIVAFATAEVTNPGWFGPMGTHARHRRHGLGRVLLRRALADLRDLGYREATIGWVGPIGFYERGCGAKISRLFWQYRKQLAPVEVT